MYEKWAYEDASEFRYRRQNLMSLSISDSKLKIQEDSVDQDLNRRLVVQQPLQFKFDPGSIFV